MQVGRFYDKWVPDNWVPDKWLLNKWALGQMGPGQMEAGSVNGGLEQIGFGENRGLMMGIKGNVYLGKIYIWKNWTLGEMGTGANRHQGKWTFGEKGCPKYPVPIFPKYLQMGTGVNGRLGEGVPQVP